MQFIPQTIPDLVLVAPKVFGDERGFFFEVWRADQFTAAGIAGPFVQDNHSRSRRGVLRGLHYQISHPQGKLVRVVEGEVLDVAVDIRRSSPTFGQWLGVRLSADNKHQLWIPPGFAHGFAVLSEHAEITYKCTDYYAPADERTIAWNDPAIGIDWGLAEAPILSAKDQAGVALAQADLFD